jgi:hypothetical protein
MGNVRPLPEPIVRPRLSCWVSVSTTSVGLLMVSTICGLFIAVGWFEQPPAVSPFHSLCIAPSLSISVGSMHTEMARNLRYNRDALGYHRESTMGSEGSHRIVQLWPNALLGEVIEADPEDAVIIVIDKRLDLLAHPRILGLGHVVIAPLARPFRVTPRVAKLQ